MAPPKKTTGTRDRIGEALYDWCRNNYDYGYVFSQDELLDAGIIPDRDLTTLLSSVQHLVQNSLFRLHDRQGGVIGWELIAPEKAKNYSDLTRDERIVLDQIDGAGSSGIWTKTIKLRSSLPAQSLDRTYKKLEAKGLIRSIKHVKHPGRKIYILAGLEPSDEATGGSWYSEGHLDVGLVDSISTVIEHFVSNQSWQVVEPDDPDDIPLSPTQKRKAPSTGFDEHGDERVKASKTHDAQHKAKKQQTKYQPFLAGYRGYPTLKEITRHIASTNVTPTVMPQNAIAQLLQVMVYDDRLFKMHRDPTGDEFPDDPSTNTITMFRSFKTPRALRENYQLQKRMESNDESVRKAAYRQQEIEDIGNAGSSVPCMRCPVFDICGDGGPVNVVTCKYFDDWYLKIAELREEGFQATSKD